MRRLPVSRSDEPHFAGGSQVWQVGLNQVQKEAPVNSIYTRAHGVDLDLVGAEGCSSFGILVRGKETSLAGDSQMDIA
jgi:hypothetical protein